jgi:hypothetical protein
VLRGDREWDSPHPSAFKYHCDTHDHGRFRLTSAHARSCYPIRVFRDHWSKSLWAPRAGIRYDGLFVQHLSSLIVSGECLQSTGTDMQSAAGTYR